MPGPGERAAAAFCTAGLSELPARTADCASTFASACRNVALAALESMVASTSPFSTLSPTLTLTEVSLPPWAKPSCSLDLAASAPLAVTPVETSPRVTVSKVGAAGWPPEQEVSAQVRPRTTVPAPMVRRRVGREDTRLLEKTNLRNNTERLFFLPCPA